MDLKVAWRTAPFRETKAFYLIVHCAPIKSPDSGRKTTTLLEESKPVDGDRRSMSLVQKWLTRNCQAFAKTFSLKVNFCIRFYSFSFSSKCFTEASLISATDLTDAFHRLGDYPVGNAQLVAVFIEKHFYSKAIQSKRCGPHRAESAISHSGKKLLRPVGYLKWL